MKKIAILLSLLAAGALGAITLWVKTPKINLGAKITVLAPQKDEDAILETVQGICSEGSCVAETLQEELSQEHDRLLKQVKIAFPLTQEKWDHALNQIALAKEHDTLLTKRPVVKHAAQDLPIVKKAREILATYNIDPSRVTIKVIHKPDTKTNAASYQGYIDGQVIHDLEINIDRISDHPEDVQAAIIRHEIMHLLNYDPLERAYIEVMLEKNGISGQEFMKEPALRNLYQHQEFRADLLAACHSIDTAHSFQKDFEHYIETYPHDQHEHNCVTHPSDKARHQAVTQLLSYMQAESKIQIA